jgi:lysophospholipase L1-like esterase
MNFSSFCKSLAAFAILFAACVHAQTPATNLLVKDGQKVVFMGDSITGMGWGDPGGFVHLVTSGLGTLGVKITPVPAGVGGNRSIEMLARLDKDVLSVKPDWLLLSCGVNDVWSRSVDLDTFKKNITSIVDQAQAAGIKVMILSPTPIYEANISEFSKKMVDYAAFMNQIAKDRNLPLADMNKAWADFIIAHQAEGGDHVVTVDGVHPNPDGHLIFARTILGAFGATPDQMAKVEAGWLAAGNNATVTIWFNLNNDALLTLRQYESLRKIAADRKTTVPALINTIHLDAMLEAMQAIQAKGDFSKVHDFNVTDATKPIFQAKLEELLK